LNNKKGISPLIATVLIIGFTIVVAVLVITWINSLVGDQTDNQACTADALGQCTDASRFLSFSAVPGAVAGDLDATVSNSGPEAYDVRVVVLASTGAQNSNQLVAVADYSDATTAITPTALGTYDVRFVVEVTGQYKDVTCNEICGEGETVTGVVVV